MSWLQLDAQSLAARARAEGAAGFVPSLAVSVCLGAIGFAVVSIAGFAPWALAGRWFHHVVGEVGLYAVCAAVFVGLSGVVLHRLIIGPGSMRRFYVLFGLAFSAYALAWTIGWILLRGNLGSVVGLLAGTGVMALIFVWAFDARNELPKVVAVLFILNALGYFIGGWVEASVAAQKGTVFLGGILSKSERRMLAMLLWGVCYGLGLGAGLGLAFFFCQRKARVLLQGS